MQCNIDQRGRRVRFVYGIVMLVVAAIVAAAATQGYSPWLWPLAALLALSGAFAIFEARRGWCAVRAMGFKTPI